MRYVMCKLSTLIEPANNMPPRMNRSGPNSFLLSCLHRKLVNWGGGPGWRYEGKPLLLLLRMCRLNHENNNNNVYLLSCCGVVTCG